MTKKTKHDCNKTVAKQKTRKRNSGKTEVTRANAVSERKKSIRKIDFFSFAVSTNVKRKKNVRTKKKQSKTRPEIEFTELYEKLDQKINWTMSAKKTNNLRN